jgi:large-conductance mechanosensitive channel
MIFLSDSASNLTNGFKETFNDFLNFLGSRNVLQTGLAFVISSNINRLASDFVENIVSPIINKVSSSEKEKLKDAKISIFGVNFEAGNFIMSILKFVITMIVIYYVFKLTGNTTKK